MSGNLAVCKESIGTNDPSGANVYKVVNEEMVGAPLLFNEVLILLVSLDFDIEQIPECGCEDGACKKGGVGSNN